MEKKMYLNLSLKSDLNEIQTDPDVQNDSTNFVPAEQFRPSN